MPKDNGILITKEEAAIKRADLIELFQKFSSNNLTPVERVVRTLETIHEDKAGVDVEPSDIVMGYINRARHADAKPS